MTPEESKLVMDEIFSQKNHDLTKQIVDLLEDEKGTDIFAILALASTYAIVNAGILLGENAREKAKDFYIGLLDLFLKASEKGSKGDRPTSPFVQ